MDYYKILGIDKTATLNDIRSAYHKQALKYHPDKNKSSSAERRFFAIKEAYEILKDTKKRGTFDDTNRQKQVDPKRLYEEELARIRKYNKDLLDKANGAREESARQTRKSSYSKDRNYFRGDIMSNLSDDEYEKVVLERLRSMC